MVVITGQVPTSALGTDAFQEADITGITMGITKHNFLVTSAQDIPRAIREAFHIATTGRPGPVLVDIPKDIVDPQNPNSAMEWYWPDSVDLPGYHPVTKGDPAMIRKAAELILASERPGHLRRRRHPEGAGGRGAARRWPSCATSTWSRR